MMTFNIDSESDCNDDESEEVLGGGRAPYY